MWTTCWSLLDALSVPSALIGCQTARLSRCCLRPAIRSGAVSREAPYRHRDAPAVLRPCRRLLPRSRILRIVAALKCAITATAWRCWQRCAAGSIQPSGPGISDDTASPVPCWHPRRHILLLAHFNRFVGSVANGRWHHCSNRRTFRPTRPAYVYRPGIRPFLNTVTHDRPPPSFRSISGDRAQAPEPIPACAGSFASSRWWMPATALLPPAASTTIRLTVRLRRLCDRLADPAGYWLSGRRTTSRLWWDGLGLTGRTGRLSLVQPLC